ncbi:MAG TPA: hypothetical protein VGR80_04465 [Steroidobacteraceae bacterium]|nr:hypothetical protein [Steroidobacteraceae bacterium]
MRTGQTITRIPLVSVAARTASRPDTQIARDCAGLACRGPGAVSSEAAEMVMVLVSLQDGYADIAGLEALHPEFAELPLKVAARTDRADREYFAWEIAALLAASGA